MCWLILWSLSSVVGRLVPQNITPLEKVCGSLGPVLAMAFVMFSRELWFGQCFFIHFTGGKGPARAITKFAVTPQIRLGLWPGLQIPSIPNPCYLTAIATATALLGHLEAAVPTASYRTANHLSY